MGNTPSTRPTDASPSSIRPSKIRKPWYLATALIVGWLFGAQGLVSGCTTIAYYRNDNIEDAITQSADDPNHPENRAHVELFTQALDAAKNRVFPLSVALFVLGGAMAIFAVRAMGGRGQARRALIQVACVHAVVVILYYLLTPDVRAVQEAIWRAQGYSLFLQRRLNQGELVARTLVSALIVLALTRERARAFFEASAPRSLSDG